MPNIYQKKILNEIPRILSMEDRDFSSPTFGCFDRPYWAWKFKDFPDATLQRAVYVLNFAFNFKEALYFKNENLREWIKAGILFWAKIQRKNGSFDQAFPNEYSYGATAFTLFPLIESFLSVKEYFSADERNCILKAIKKSADFLLVQSEVHGFISNHLAGSALSLLEAGILLDSENCQVKARKLIQLIIKNQSEEGWYREYEGPDPGYETLGISYLSKYYKKTKDYELLESLNKSIDFLSYFIHPDATFGGEYGSRNTEIFYPAGLEILKSEIPMAAKIAKIMADSIENDKTVALSYLDDENLIALAVNYASASSNETVKNDILLPCEKDNFEKFFSDSKIFIKSTDKYYAICNAFKGGVIKIFDKRKRELIFEDFSYIGEAGRKIISTQIYNPDSKVFKNNSCIEIKATFMEVLGKPLTPFKMAVLRILNLTLFKNLFLGNFIKKIMIKMLISKKSAQSAFLERKICFLKDLVVIDDILRKENLNFSWLFCKKKFSAIHMGSSKYFQISQLNSNTLADIDVKKLNRENILKIKRELKF